MVFLNGEFIPKNQASVSVMDRGFLFGDGVYEVIPVYSGQVFRLHEHLARLQNSLDAIQIQNPYSIDKYQHIFNELLSHSLDNNHSVYLQITRGTDTTRKHKFDELAPTVFIELNPLTPKTKPELEKGYCAITQPDFRWQRCDIKATSLLANIMYAQQAKQHRAGLNIQESISNIDEIFSADEVWISSSTREVMPITTIDSKLINNGKIGQHWSQVYDHYQSLKYAG